MNCFRRAFSCLSHIYAWIYEPKLTLQEMQESIAWKRPGAHTNGLWSDIQSRNSIKKPLSAEIEKVATFFEKQPIQKKIAIDLGCGISPTAYHLLERGWKVYAIDVSMQVLSDLATQIANLRKPWVENEQLILLNQNMETFEIFEKVHLVIAIDSLPHCTPEKVEDIFKRIKNSLLPNGRVLCNTYLSKHHKIHQFIGTWTAKKSVIETIIRKTNFALITAQENKDKNQCYFLAS